MSRRAQKPCGYPGCHVLVDRGYCRLHSRPSSSAVQGYDVRHKRWRLAVLARDPVCRWPGCTEPAVVADHIVPISLGGARFDLQNGQGLCITHNAVKTNRYDHRRAGRMA